MESDNHIYWTFSTQVTVATAAVRNVYVAYQIRIDQREGAAMGVSDGRQSPPGSVVTAARAGAVLLVTATIALLVALCLPWWALRMQVFQDRWVTVSPAFSGWGWLSFAAWLVALTMTLRLVVVGWPHGNRLAQPGSSLGHRDSRGRGTARQRDVHRLGPED